MKISGLTIAGGNAGKAGSGANGGGIDNFGPLTVTDSVFSGNSSNESSSIANESGRTLTVRDSSFTSNSADTGGGLDNLGSVTVSGSTFTSSGHGGLDNEMGRC